MANGTEQAKVPDSNGIWEKINAQVQQTKNKSNERKRRMNALLKRSQSIVKGLHMPLLCSMATMKLIGLTSYLVNY